MLPLVEQVQAPVRSSYNSLRMGAVMISCSKQLRLSLLPLLQFVMRAQVSGSTMHF